LIGINMNKQHSDFISTVRQSVADGLPVLVTAFSHLQEYDLLDYANAITAEDFEGENERLNKADLDAAVSAIRSLQAALAANSAAGLKALFKAAR
jgi:hypothetical protein